LIKVVQDILLLSDYSFYNELSFGDIKFFIAVCIELKSDEILCMMLKKLENNGFLDAENLYSILHLSARIRNNEPMPYTLFENITQFRLINIGGLRTMFDTLLQNEKLPEATFVFRFIHIFELLKTSSKSYDSKYFQSLVEAATRLQNYRILTQAFQIFMDSNASYRINDLFFMNLLTICVYNGNVRIAVEIFKYYKSCFNYVELKSYSLLLMSFLASLNYNENEYLKNPKKKQEPIDNNIFDSNDNLNNSNSNNNLMYANNHLNNNITENISITSTNETEKYIKQSLNKFNNHNLENNNNNNNINNSSVASIVKSELDKIIKFIIYGNLDCNNNLSNYVLRYFCSINEPIAAEHYFYRMISLTHRPCALSMHQLTELIAQSKPIDRGKELKQLYNTCTRYNIAPCQSFKFFLLRFLSLFYGINTLFFILTIFYLSLFIIIIFIIIIFAFLI
jgi:hypothetical protein